MKYWNETVNSGEFKAEVLLSAWDIDPDFDVQMEGVFPRNFEDDLIGIENGDEKPVVTLSRDGIFHLLPEGLFFPENMLKNESRRSYDFKREHTELKKRKKEAMSFFKFFDTEFFKLDWALENKVNDFAKNGTTILNNSFLSEANTDTTTDNRYIAKIKTLLPFASQIRGNIPLLVDILKCVISVEKIEVVKIGLFHQRFMVYKEGLNSGEYMDMDKELTTFFDYFCHWFLPFELQYDFRIKDDKQTFTLGNPLILDYNTHL